MHVLIWFYTCTGNEASSTLRKKLLDQRVVQPIVEMTRASNFPVLKNDGVIALSSILAAWQMEDSQDIINGTPLSCIVNPPITNVQFPCYSVIVNYCGRTTIT